MIKHVMVRAVFAFAMMCACSCSHCDDDEIWREKVTLDDGSHIMVYHTNKCSEDKPLFSVNEKKIDFIQTKNSVFDFCFSEEEIYVLFVISNDNIRKMEESFFPEDDSDMDYYSRFSNLVDTEYRTYECYYSLSDGELIELEEAYCPR